MEKGMVQVKISMKEGEPILEFDGREMESAILTKTKDGFKGEMRFIELVDKDYLSVPREFEKMHIELVTLLKNAKAVDALYNLFTSIDAIRAKHFSEYDVIPYYSVRLVMKILLEHGACRYQNGGLRKTELFTRFLLLRAEMAGMSAFGKGTLKDVDAILNAEEKSMRRYTLPPMDELKSMSYEMLTMEMAKAEELMAKPKYMKVLKTLRTEKSATKIRKTEKQVMDEAIREERDVQDGEHETVSTTRLAKHQKRKAEQQRKDEERFEKKSKGAAIKQIKPNEEYIG